MNELKPCPFCGSDDVGVYKQWILGSVWKHVVKCKGCSATIDKCTLSEYSLAVDAWNRRVNEKGEKS